MKSHISKNPKTGRENAQTSNATPQLALRPFAPIREQTTSPIDHQKQQTEGLAKRKTNLLEIPGLTAPQKKPSNPDIQLKGSVSNVSSQVVQRVEQEQEEKMDIDSEEPDLSSKTKKRKKTGNENEEKPNKKIKQSNQEQEDNKDYVQGIRKTVGEKLDRESITQSELNFLIGRDNWVRKIEAGATKKIKPIDRNKLEDLLTRSRSELENTLKAHKYNSLHKKQEDNNNRGYVQGIRKTLGEKLDRESITQAELNFLIGTFGWANRIEGGATKKIKPKDRNKLEGLLTRSRSELENILKAHKYNSLHEKQEDNKGYVQGIRKTLGEKLDRKLITQSELSFLIGKNNWANKIEMGATKRIKPEDRKTLKDLLTTSQSELKNLLENYEVNVITKEQEDNKAYLQGIKKTLAEKLGRKSITQAELSFLIGRKLKWVSRIEEGSIKEIKLEDRKKLKDLLTKSQLELKKSLEDYEVYAFTEDKRSNKTYLVDIRKKLGERLERKNQPITQEELDVLMDTKDYVRRIESGILNKITIQDEQDLKDLLTKSRSELENLFKDYECNKITNDSEEQGPALVKTLFDQNSNLSLGKRRAWGSRKAFIVKDNSADHVDYDPQQTSGSQRLSTYASTLVLANWPEGIEFQGSIKHGGRSIALSSNRNRTNALVSKSIKMASDLQNLAAQSLTSHNIEAMSREDAMNNRDIRHTMKLYDRLPVYLEPDAGVLVPQNTPSKDGIHAEIRIVSEKKWTKSDWDVPKGTKYPCLGCYLHLNSQKIEIGHFHGPLWLTNAGLSQQLEASLKGKNKIGEMSSAQISHTAELLATSYAQRPGNSKFVMGLTRSGKATYGQDADSDSDLDEETFTSVVKRVKAHHSGALPTFKKDVNGLFINQTVGDGNCFFHAVHEAMHNIRSTQAYQTTIRQTVTDQLQNDQRVRKHLFGENPDLAGIAQVVAGLAEGEWTQDYTVGYVAEALNLTIHIYNEDGSVRYTGNPTDTSTSGQTIHITFTGNHFNSHTQSPLP